ncbi:putative Misato 1-like protein [Naja naja]|nr:putative Misato 1-like protein [Naja naja]
MSSGVREVVTLQLGHYAGSVGAHWWGLQHDVLFRTGRTMQGCETFTPRLILMDLKESLATLKQEGYLYEDPQKNIPIAWLEQPQGDRFSNGDVASKRLPGGKPQQLGKPLVPERLAPAWTDFLRTKLHPRTILTIHEYNREE